MDIEHQDTPQGEYERERYIERENERYDLADEIARDAKRAVATHKSIMRAMGLDEQHEKFLWDATH